jgi:hypothetical protein
MARYLVVDATGLVVNAIEWDGVTPYNPDHDHEHVQHDTAGPGWKWSEVDGDFVPPPQTGPSVKG